MKLRLLGKALLRIFTLLSLRWKYQRILKLLITQRRISTSARIRFAKPRVFIPVFPGTNCEYDTARAFELAGAETDIRVFKNLTAEDIKGSVEAFTEGINNAQIVMFPGGFSAGDEPEGSAKFFATAFRNEKMSEAVNKLLNKRDGLALGICKRFPGSYQAWPCS